MRQTSEQLGGTSGDGVTASRLSTKDLILSASLVAVGIACIAYIVNTEGLQPQQFGSDGFDWWITGGALIGAGVFHLFLRWFDKRITVKQFRFSLRTALLLFTTVAVLVAVAAEHHRARLRAQLAERKADALRFATLSHDAWTGLLKKQIVTDPVSASQYKDEIRKADAKLEEVKRTVNEWK